MGGRDGLIGRGLGGLEGWLRVANPKVSTLFYRYINDLSIDGLRLCRGRAPAPDVACRQPGQLHDDVAVDVRLELRRDDLGDEAGKDLPVLYAALSALYEPSSQTLWVTGTRPAGELYRLLNRFGDNVRRALRPAERVSALAGLER